ncbi:MAG: efflux RND transporter periplasmic adaptor subunit, partial [Limisphaerales bacterium]
MKLKRILISVVVLLVLAAAITAFVKTRGPVSGGGDESSDENIPTIVSVQVGTLTNVTLHRYISGYATIEAAPATATEASGGAALATSTPGIIAGINVAAGQRVKKGDVLMELDSSTATFDYAKAELRRQQKLFAQQNTSLKNVEAAAAQLASLEVVAPVSGTVVRLNVRPGQAVDTTTTLAEIIDLDRLAISIKVPLAQAS